MSKRQQRREQSNTWKDANSNLSLEDVTRLGYGLNIEEDDYVPRKSENAIVPSGDKEFLYKRFLLKPTGIIIPDDLTQDEWLDIFKVLRKLNEVIQWSVGDLINHAESEWGNTYTEMADITGYSEKTLRDYAYVARSVELSIRQDNLSFAHHQVVAGLKDPITKEPLAKEQTKWLKKAEENGWSSKRLRQEISAAQQAKKGTEKDNWLFGKDTVPSIDKRFQTLWTKAKHGDQTARTEFLKEAKNIYDWLDKIVESLDE